MYPYNEMSLLILKMNLLNDKLFTYEEILKKYEKYNIKKYEKKEDNIIF